MALLQSVPAHIPLFASTRGYGSSQTTECVHWGSVAVVDASGAILAAAGDPQALHFTRSTLKPFQALPFVEDGGMARFGFGSQELALMCASHSGETMHVELARRMLERIDASPACLQCGSQVPQYFEAVQRPVPDAVTGTVLAHNCSGKHSGFLAYCRLHGHDFRGYLDPDGSLQTRIRNAVQQWIPGAPSARGRDGCNAPNLAITLTDLARLYARLACDDGGALAALRYAMTRHPELVSGTGRSDLQLSQHGAGDWVCKIGADGLQAISIRSKGIGIVVRVASGSRPATLIATLEVLHQIGLLDDPCSTALAHAFRPQIRNASGHLTGAHVPLVRLPRLFS